MKVVVISGSPRENANTEIMMKHVVEYVKQKDVELKFINLSEFLLQTQNFYINGNELITISFYTFNIIVDTWGKKVYVEIG